MLWEPLSPGQTSHVRCSIPPFGLRRVAIASFLIVGQQSGVTWTSLNSQAPRILAGDNRRDDVDTPGWSFSKRYSRALNLSAEHWLLKKKNHLLYNHHLKLHWFKEEMENVCLPCPLFNDKEQQPRILLVIKTLKLLINNHTQTWVSPSLLQWHRWSFSPFISMWKITRCRSFYFYLVDWNRTSNSPHSNLEENVGIVANQTFERILYRSDLKSREGEALQLFFFFW